MRDLLVFDIETVPDRRFHEGDSFPKLPFHRVVAIAFLKATVAYDGDSEVLELIELRAGGTEQSTEADLVGGFFQLFSDLRQPKLVTYNGRKFDLPVLRYRAMHHGVQVPALYRSGSRFESYGYRYSEENHCDLLDALTDFGAAKPMKLDDIARLLGLPGKLGIDGGDVAGLFEEGELGRIRDYCETDVLTTYLVYLHHRFHTGYLTKASLEASINSVRDYLSDRQHDRPHLKEYVDAWNVAYAGTAP